MTTKQDEIDRSKHIHNAGLTRKVSMVSTVKTQAALATKSSRTVTKR